MVSSENLGITHSDGISLISPLPRHYAFSSQFSPTIFILLLTDTALLTYFFEHSFSKKAFSDSFFLRFSSSNGFFFFNV